MHRQIRLRSDAGIVTPRALFCAVSVIIFTQHPPFASGTIVQTELSSIGEKQILGIHAHDNQMGKSIAAATRSALLRVESNPRDGTQILSDHRTAGARPVAFAPDESAKSPASSALHEIKQEDADASPAVFHTVIEPSGEFKIVGSETQNRKASKRTATPAKLSTSQVQSDAMDGLQRMRNHQTAGANFEKAINLEEHEARSLVSKRSKEKKDGANFHEYTLEEDMLDDEPSRRGAWSPFKKDDRRRAPPPPTTTKTQTTTTETETTITTTTTTTTTTPAPTTTRRTTGAPAPKTAAPAPKTTDEPAAANEAKKPANTGTIIAPVVLLGLCVVAMAVFASTRRKANNTPGGEAQTPVHGRGAFPAGQGADEYEEDEQPEQRTVVDERTYGL